jgi:hypothetical protein
MYYKYIRMKNVNQKLCKVCEETKDIYEFDMNRRICKICRKVMNSSYYDSNKLNFWKYEKKRKSQSLPTVSEIPI